MPDNLISDWEIRGTPYGSKIIVGKISRSLSGNSRPGSKVFIVPQESSVEVGDVVTSVASKKQYLLGKPR